MVHKSKSIIEIELMFVKSFIEDWMNDMKRSANTLSAIFRDVCLKSKSRSQIIDMAARDLGADVRSDDSFAQKAFRISEAAARQGYELKGWHDFVPTLKVMNDKLEGRQTGVWTKAKIARETLRNDL